MNGAHVNGGWGISAFREIGTTPLSFLEHLKADISRAERSLRQLAKYIEKYKHHPEENCIVSLYNDLTLLETMIADINQKIRKANARGIIIVSGRLMAIQKQFALLRQKIAELPDPYK